MKIFLLGISKYDWQKKNMIPLNISHTNRALRQLALSSPCLWTKMSFTLDDDDGDDDDDDDETYDGEQLYTRAEHTAKLFELWIERSRNALLNCCIVTKTFARMADRIFSLLLREQWRWQSITISFEDLVFQDHDDGFSFAVTNIPNLQKLDLTFMLGGEDVLTLDLSRSRRLQYLDLKQMNSHRWREISETIYAQQLTHLYLELLDSPRDDFLITSLTMFPRLAHLELIMYFKHEPSLGELSNAPPVLLPNLRVLKLGVACGDLLNYFTTPSLVSLDIPMCAGTEVRAYEFIQRSKPSLEVVEWMVWGDLDIDQIRSILHELHTLKKLILYNWDKAYIDKTMLLWQLLSINSPDDGVLLPNLKELEYSMSYRWGEERLRKLVILVADMVLSRCQYTRDFTLHLDDIDLGKALKGVENFESVRECISNGCNVTIGFNRQKILHFHFL